MAAARLHRLARELDLLRKDPPPGVAAWPVDEADISRFHASESMLGSIDGVEEVEVESHVNGSAGDERIHGLPTYIYIHVHLHANNRHPGTGGHALRGRRLPPRAGALRAVRGVSPPCVSRD